MIMIRNMKFKTKLLHKNVEIVLHMRQIKRFQWVIKENLENLLYRAHPLYNLYVDASFMRMARDIKIR